MNPAEQLAYLKGQIVANLLINSGLNALIAYFSYRSRALVPLAEMAVDIAITVAIISFLVAWLGVLSARQKMAAQPWNTRAPFPANAALRALLIMAGALLVFGGLGLIAPLTLLSPDGMSGWGYIVFKTVYTGACAVGTVLLVVWSVFREYTLVREIV
jgi:hypothetical protein